MPRHWRSPGGWRSPGRGGRHPRALAEDEAGPHGVTVNAVAPGVTNTETVGEHIAPDRTEAVAQGQALRRQA